MPRRRKGFALARRPACGEEFLQAGHLLSTRQRQSEASEAVTIAITGRRHAVTSNRLARSRAPLPVGVERHRLATPVIITRSGLTRLPPQIGLHADQSALQVGSPTCGINSVSAGRTAHDPRTRATALIVSARPRRLKTRMRRTPSAPSALGHASDPNPSRRSSTFRRELRNTTAPPSRKTGYQITSRQWESPEVTSG